MMCSVNGAVMTIRKRRPQPPKYWDPDECWNCKQRRGCGGCKHLKRVVAFQKRKKRRRQDVLLRGSLSR